MTNSFGFDSVQQNGTRVKLTNRGNKPSGVSFDYMDQLNQFIDQGIFYDKNGDGFTKAEKLALQDEFTKIHQEKGYNTNFKTMQVGKKSEFDYTYEEFVRLAEAAGYVLKEQKPAEEEKVEEQKPVEEQAVETTPEAEAKKENDEVKVNITVNPDNEEEDADVITINASEEVGYSIESFSVEENEEGIETVDVVTITSDKPINVEDITVEVDDVIEVRQDKTETPATEAEKTEAPAQQQAPAQAEAEAEYEEISLDDLKNFSKEERDSILKDVNEALTAQVREAEQTSYTVQRRGKILGLPIGKKISEKVDYTEAELAERQANLPELKTQLREVQRTQEYYRQVVDSNTWSSRINPGSALNVNDEIEFDENGKDKKYQGGREVTAEDGRRLIRVDHYDSKTLSTNYNYFNPTVERMGTVLEDKNGNPFVAGSPYWGIAADTSNEVTDSGLPENDKIKRY